MSTASSTESRSSDIDLGQRYYVLGIFAAFFAEVAVAVSNFGHWSGWATALFGVCSSIIVIWLGNWLYSGNKTALTVTRFWVTLQLILTLTALGSLLRNGESPLSPSGVTETWHGLLKLLVYAGLARILMLPGVTLDFLGVKRGESHVTSQSATTVDHVAIGAPFELTTEHTKLLDGLASAMSAASIALLAVGAAQLLMGVSMLGGSAPSARAADSVESLGVRAWLMIAESIAVAALGAVLGAPAIAVQTLVQTTPRHTGLVMNFLGSMLSAWQAYLVILLALAVVAICRLVF